MRAGRQESPSFLGKVIPTEHKINAAAEWDKANTVQVKMKLQKTTDADILQYLQTVTNKQGLLKQLLRDHIAGVTSTSET